MNDGHSTAKGMAVPGSVAGQRGPRPVAAAYAGVAVEHWHLLFEAVTARLVQIGDAHDAAVQPLPGVDNTGSTRARILECVEALEQLRRTALHAGFPEVDAIRPPPAARTPV